MSRSQIPCSSFTPQTSRTFQDGSEVPSISQANSEASSGLPTDHTETCSIARNWQIPAQPFHLTSHSDTSAKSSGTSLGQRPVEYISSIPGADNTPLSCIFQSADSVIKGSTSEIHEMICPPSKVNGVSSYLPVSHPLYIKLWTKM